ncbi:TPA: VENN motif pre-toxin domain-containing protein [Mannheimia haemolytica]|nr:VENN motif pre-toxin domain-containing protein [Mannheimia haemolytica]
MLNILQILEVNQPLVLVRARTLAPSGAYRQGVDAVTNAVGLALGGSSTAGVVTGAISPYINTEIKQATEGNTEANLIAHALWGAVEAYAQGGKAGAGAVAVVTGEVSANIISQNLFGKEPENLTEAEKRTVSELSQVAAGLAGGLASSSGSSLSTAQAVKTGLGIGKNAVENNFFDDLHPSEERKQTIVVMAKALIEGIEGAIEVVQHFDETIVTIAKHWLIQSLARLSHTRRGTSGSRLSFAISQRTN